MTPDQLSNKQQIKRDKEKAAYTYVQRMEKRAAFEMSLTLDELCNTQQITKINKKKPVFEERKTGCLQRVIGSGPA